MYTVSLQLHNNLHKSVNAVDMLLDYIQEEFSTTGMS